MGSRHSDLITIKNYLSGDSEAFKRIDHQIDKAFLKFSNRIGYEKDDVLSDVHLKLYNELGKPNFKLEKGLNNLIRVLVFRTCIDYLRYRKTKNQSNIESVVISDAKPSPEKNVIDEELRKINFRVIRLASRECRKLWKMFLLDCLTYKEMASELGKTETNVRQKMWKCREKAKHMRERILKKDEQI